LLAPERVRADEEGESHMWNEKESEGDKETSRERERETHTLRG